MTPEMFTSEPGIVERPKGHGIENFKGRTLEEMSDSELRILIGVWNRNRVKEEKVARYAYKKPSLNAGELLTKVKGRLGGEVVPDAEKEEMDYNVDIFLEYCAEKGIDFQTGRDLEATSSRQAA